MIKIRKGLFETNSSSGDVYDDYDDDGVEDDFEASFSLEFFFDTTDSKQKLSDHWEDNW